MHTLAGNPEFFRDMSNRTTRQDTTNKNQPTGRSQTRITVNQEKASSPR
jgi:hypothetical protein